MRKSTRALIFIILGLSLQSSAAQFGADHNRYLDCLIKVLSPGETSMRVILEALVYNCGYKPTGNINTFLNTYTALGETTLQNVSGDSLEAVIAPYRNDFSEHQKRYLLKIESIVKNQRPIEAARSLDDLYQRAVAFFCPNFPRPSTTCTNSDIAVLAAIDIGASSSRYWREVPPQKSLRAKWWQIVLADVAGGIVGGVFGGGVGAVGLGSACSVAVAGA